MITQDGPFCEDCKYYSGADVLRRHFDNGSICYAPQSHYDDPLDRNQKVTRHCRLRTPAVARQYEELCGPAGNWFQRKPVRPPFFKWLFRRPEHITPAENFMFNTLMVMCFAGGAGLLIIVVGFIAIELVK